MRVFDADLDDYVDLPESVPKGDPRFEELRQQSRDAMNTAYVREKARTPE